MFGLSTEQLLSRIIVLVIAFSVHEFAHAWTADQLGDDTPRLQGRLTLNPLAHLDPFGSIMLLIAGFGWAKPVLVNPYAVRRRTPAGMMLVAAAGPFSNLILAILASIPFRAGLIPVSTGSPFFSTLFLEFIWINLILLFFNLIPIFPLDGEKVAEYFPSARRPGFPVPLATLRHVHPHGFDPARQFRGKHPGILDRHPCIRGYAAARLLTMDLALPGEAIFSHATSPQ